MKRYLPFLLVLAMATPVAAGPLGIRNATASVDCAAADVQQTLVDLRHTLDDVDQTVGRLDRLIDDCQNLLQGFRRKGHVEVEFRHRRWHLFSIRLVLPEPQATEDGCDN